VLQVLQLQLGIFSTIRHFRLPLRGNTAKATKTKLAKLTIVVKVVAIHTKSI
jgi:hypothetical protein